MTMKFELSILEIVSSNSQQKKKKSFHQSDRVSAVVYDLWPSIQKERKKN